MQALKKLRLAKAEELLKDSHFSIKTIAIEVGFKDPNHFSRLFQKEKGCSPSAYRLHNGRH